MRPVTLQQLRDQIRDRYDLPEYQLTSGFITSVGVDRLINSALQQYYGLLLECYGDNYFSTTTTFTTIANLNITSLPSRCIKLHSLYWIRGTNDIVTIPRASIDVVSLGLDTANTWSNIQPSYRLQGQAILWLPTPSQEYNITCTYSALPEDLTSLSAAFDAGPGHEEYIVSEVCRRIAVREDKDPSVYMSERQDLERTIRSQASQRTDTSSLTLRDAYNDHYESDYARYNRLARL